MLNSNLDISTIHRNENFNKISDSYKFTNKNKLEEVAQEFESLLVYEMFKEMNKNITFQNQNDTNNVENIFIKKNQAEKIFNDFLTYEKSKMSVKTGDLNLGLAKTIIQQYNLYK